MDTVRAAIVEEVGPKRIPKPGDDDFEAAVELDIDAFYKAMFSDENLGEATSEDEWNEENIFQEPVPHFVDKHVEPEASADENALTRSAQLTSLSETATPCVYLTVHHMFESYEFQLWNVVPVITVKELIEDITDINPEDMRLYMKSGVIMEDAKTLNDYDIVPESATVDSPVRLFVGFRVDLEEVSEEELADEEDEDEETEFDLSPGLEYFETLSDVDFTEEIIRDRDFDDWDADVDFGPGYELVKPVSCSEEPKDPAVAKAVADGTFCRFPVEEVYPGDGDDEDELPTSTFRKKS